MLLSPRRGPQALLGALPGPLRALCLARLAAGPSTEVSALALQRLQREIAATSVTAATAALPLPLPLPPPPLPQMMTISVFTTPWVLRPVLQQLMPLLPPAMSSAITSAAALRAAGKAAAAAVGTSDDDGGGGRAPLDDDAIDALTSRADAATAAVSVLRFLALRHRAATATATATAAAAASGDVAAEQATAARGAVLTFVYDNAVGPLHGHLSAVLGDMRRRVEMEGAPEARGVGSSSVADAAVGGHQQGCDRFASNVALVSDAVAGLTAVSRLQEVTDCLAELLLRPPPPPPPSDMT